MQAAELLNQYQVTMDQAKDWIMAHLNDPALIFNTARSVGLDSAMLAQIVAPVLPGVTDRQVEDFFTSQGLPGSQLHHSSSSSDLSLLSEGLAGLSSLITMNTNSGVLSTEALRKAALDMLPDDASYYALFDPSNYKGAADHYFSGEDLGMPGHAGFAATAANFESVYYGSMIKTFKAVDYSELMAFDAFIKQHDFTELGNNPGLVKEYTALLLSVFEDQASHPVYDDQHLASAIVQSIIIQANNGAAGEELIGLQSAVDGLSLF